LSNTSYAKPYQCTFAFLTVLLLASTKPTIQPYLQLGVPVSGAADTHLIRGTEDELPQSLPLLIPQSPDGQRHLVPNLDLASLNPTAAFSSSIGGSFTHHRRRSSTNSSNVPHNLNLQVDRSDSRGSSPLHSAQTLETIPGTPNLPMSLSRSPSPRPGGGWASPGLNSPYASVSGRSSPAKSYRGNNGGSNSVTWESAKAKSDGINGYPSFSTHNNGFFNRHYRNISNSLPHFSLSADKSYAEKEKLGRGRWMARDGGRIARVRSLVRRISRKAKIRFLLVVSFILMIILFYTTRKVPRRSTCQSLLTADSSSLLVA
jgi:hypothetical protein